MADGGSLSLMSAQEDSTQENSAQEDPEQQKVAEQQGDTKQHRDAEQQDCNYCLQQVSLIFNCFFYLCCFLSAQYHMSSTGDENDNDDCVKPNINKAGSHVDKTDSSFVDGTEDETNSFADGTEDETNSFADETKSLVGHDETSRHRYKRKKNLSVPHMIIAVIQVIMFSGFVVINIAHVTLNVIVEVCQIMHITCSPSVFENETVNCTMPYQYWKISTAILASTITELFSYITMTIVLYLIYGYFRKYCCEPIANCPCCCSSVKEALKQDKPFSPFCDSCTCCQNSSTALTPEQPNAWFSLHYLICMLIFICTIITSIYGNEMYQKYPCQINGINVASYVLFLICQFCSIQSVFIFSKIVYIITGQLEKLIEVMDKVNDENLLKKIDPKTPNEGPNDLRNYLEIEEGVNYNLKGLLESTDEHKRNKGLYYLLRNIDQKFTEQKAKPILKLFGCWFIVHWTLNALTTVLLSAVIIELVLDLLAYKWKNADEAIPTEDASLEAAYIAYLVMFVGGHAYLFVYPCFRAASITATHEKLIVGVSRRQWHHIPHPVETRFIQYLKTQNFSFKVPLCCVEFSFNFTLAFVSLFIGILGGFLNLHFS